MLSRSLRFLVRWRVLFLALWILVTAATASLLPGLRFEFSLHPLLKGNDEQVSSVREFYETFPPAEGNAVIAATFEDVITVAQLRRAAAWAAELEDLPEVMEVYSPAMLLELNVQGFTLDEWARLGGTGGEPIELGNGPGMNTIRGRYLSHDLHSLALHVRRAKRVPQADFVEVLHRVTAQWEHPVRILGIEIVLSDMAGQLRHDLIQLLALQAFALLVVLPLFFRSFRMAYLPLLASIIGLLAYLGILSVAGQPLGLIYLAGPLLIVSIGLSDSIHLQQKFDEARAEGLDVPAALTAMLRSVGVACVLTSLTTGIGFLSLLLAPHEEVRNFGLWCAIGDGVAFFVVVLIMPVLLACSPGSGKPARLRAHFDPTRLQRPFAIPALVVLTAISSGIAFVKVDSSIARELPPETESVRNLDWFAANFQGSDRIELDITGALDDPEVFAAVERIQAELSRENGSAGSSSYVDLIRFTLPAEVVDTKDGPHLEMRALGELDPFPENLVTRSGDRACILFYASN